jgi:two-component system phosphate regulon sensor histidine kinase PhoR
MKYSPNDRRIEVQVAREDGLACVKVIDHGAGVPRTEQRKIFRKFYRVEADTFGPQGSGLGLAIVDHIMRAHHGQVRVDSEPGRGSTFTLCFRLDETAAIRADPEPADTEPSRRAS